jgi:hypothetical protein
MAPVCQIKENLAIYTDLKWQGYQVEFIEPQPRSSQFIVDLIAIAGVGPLAAGGNVAAQLLQAIQVSAGELCHFRFFVLDNIEAQLWQLSNMARFAPRGGQAGVNLFTPALDPYLASTTFWVLGGLGDRDARIGCTNISGAVQPVARVGFFGFRYILKPLGDNIPQNARYLPAQGR